MLPTMCVLALWVVKVVLALDVTAPADDWTVRMPCYSTVEEALLNGEQEDSTCATFSRDGIVIVGPAWYYNPTTDVMLEG